MNAQDQYEVCKCTDCLDQNLNGILVHKRTKKAHEKRNIYQPMLDIMDEIVDNK